jgi:hypothetical protein
MLPSTSEPRDDLESPESSVQIREAIPSEYADLDNLAVDAWQILRSGYSPEQWDGLIAAVARMSKIAGSGKVLVAVDDPKFTEPSGTFPGSSNPRIFPAD